MAFQDGELALNALKNTVESLKACEEKQKTSTFFSWYFGYGINTFENGCPLLAAFQYNRKACVSIINKLFGPVRPGDTSFFHDSLAPSLDLWKDLRKAIILRAAHLLLLDRIQDESPEDLHVQCETLLTQYQKFFGTNTWNFLNNFIRDASKRLESLQFWFGLFERIDTNGKLTNCLVEISKTSYDGSLVIFDPAFPFFLHTSYLALQGDSQSLEAPKVLWAPGVSWGVAASLNPVQSNGLPNFGCLYQLRIEDPSINAQASGSCGVVYPSPVHGAYMKISQDFQEGILNAWIVSRKVRGLEKDVSFAIIPKLDDKFQYLMATRGITGSSMSAAFGIALRSHIDSIRLRNDAVCSCGIEFRGMGYSDESLSEVDLLDSKCHVVNIFNKNQTSTKILRKIFAVNKPDKFPLSEVDVVQVSSFSELFDHMTLNEKWLEEYRNYQAGRWQRIGGTPYTG
jgi:hypothetical protein